MRSFKDYNGRVVIMGNGELANGTYPLEGCYFRFKNGLLNNELKDDGKVLPAIESKDGTHVEFYENGKLHRKDGPAIIDLLDNIEEWWFEGHRFERKG
ncbi:MAG: hypothetical protein K5930_02840 [Treponemataceae bacterium]|nr:hypothetical protein [Treponemataceae bacterium]